MSRPPAAVLLFLALVPRARASEADLYLGKDRAALFESYAADVRDGQYLSEKGFARLGTTWAREVARARERFLAARTKADVYYALVSLKNSVHDGHSRLLVPDSLRVPDAWLSLPLSFSPVRRDGKLRFVVAGSRLAAAPDGLVLETYRGRTPESLMPEFLEWLDSSSPEAWESDFAQALAHRNLARVPPLGNGDVALRLRDEKTGRAVDVAARFAPPGEGAPQARRASKPRPEDDEYAGRPRVFTGINYAVYQDTAAEILILRYTSYFDAERFRREPPELSYAPAADLDWSDEHEAGDRLARRDIEELGRFLKKSNGAYRRLLIDVRRGSAYHPVSRALLEMLAQKPFKTTTNAMVFTPLMRRDGDFFEEAMHMSSRAQREVLRREFRGGAALSSRFTFYCKTSKCAPEEGDCEPSPLGLRYQLYVLSGPYCASACDQFVSIVADNGLGEVVGLPSMGASSPFRGDRSFRLADGETFKITLNAGITYRADGEVLEGNPARPSRLVRPVPGRDYLADVLAALP